jgi:UDP-N-acetylmuramoyl-tripeptide--D-alanyl-D-alanine ligase
MNRAGEITELASVLKPSIAVITNIGPAHIGILGSIEAIAKEKKEIFSQFQGGETALVPEDDPLRDYLSSDLRGRVIFYGQKRLEALGKLTNVTSRGLAGTEILWEGKSAVFGLPGRHNLKNALAAASIALEAGAGDEAIRRGFAMAKPLFGRSEILQGATTVIRDCYNSNPDSAAEALAFCDSIDWNGRRVYIIGEMLELGEHSSAAHRELGQRLAVSKADMVFLYGKETESAAFFLKAKNVPFFYTDTMDELSKKVSQYIRNGDMVLLKGSRGCALEELTDIVYKKGEGKNVS